MAFDIEDVINNKKLVAYFQPVISIAKKNVCGLEGLIRGTNTDTGEIISPLELFNAAECRAVQLELDRACRETIIQTYMSIYERRKDMLLFLNIHSPILDKAVGSNHLINMVRHYRIKPADIVIEINESKVQDTVLLKKFVDTYRNYGFLIALDDMGSGFSNLDRISIIKPDIVKTDMSLTRNICADFYVQEVFRSLVSLSMKIGALVVAEGVETEEEAIQTLELGANMIQGFYLSKPQKMNDILSESLNRRINIIAESFQYLERNKIIRNRRRNNKLKSIMSGVTMRLALVSAENFDAELLQTVNSSDLIECAYILDETGIQASSTVFSSSIVEIKRNRLFSPAEIGADHSLKIYYRYLKSANTRRYITEPYASLASGNLCITFANTFQDRHNKKYILCIDFKVNGMKY
jgi:EAL domain-containing protein (putative c-di-GMP-specific phosphodiesterase class I)